METKRNLEQRLLAVRAAVPRLAPKKYSDQIKYKYNKISDVYEHLGPAMEANGVLLHVTGETATRRYEDGSPMFWQPYETRTKYGDARTLWIYESDITLEWSNADDPSDTRTMTIHALGTNDGGPDKAKGSAWTYALKYWLFEELGVDQGEDDPDNRVEDQPPQQRQPQRQTRQQPARPAAAPQQAQTAPAPQQAATAPVEGTIPGGPDPAAKAAYDAALSAAMHILDGITDAASANASMARWHQIVHAAGSDKAANAAWIKHMRRLRLTWDAAAGGYVDATPAGPTEVA